MSYIHNQLLRRGKLADLLPEETETKTGDKSEVERVRAEIAARAAEEQRMSREVAFAIGRLRELDQKNHYGESLRKAFGGS